MENSAERRQSNPDPVKAEEGKGKAREPTK